MFFHLQKKYNFARLTKLKNKNLTFSFDEGHYKIKYIEYKTFSLIFIKNNNCYWLSD